MYITTRDINPGHVGAIGFCKAPLCGRRLDLGSLNLTPRFAHQLADRMFWRKVCSQLELFPRPKPASYTGQDH